MKELFAMRNVFIMPSEIGQNAAAIVPGPVIVGFKLNRLLQIGEGFGKSADPSLELAPLQVVSLYVLALLDLSRFGGDLRLQDRRPPGVPRCQLSRLVQGA